VAAINPEFLFCFKKNYPTHLKPIRFKLSKNWLAEKRTVLRINLFIEIAVSSDDSIEHGPETLASLRHGVPGEEPHYLPDVRDQALVFLEDLL
jgi:hypothetical protein